MMSGRIHSLKRRDPDDLVLDLQNVSLSPSKKLRVSETGVSGVAGSGSIFTTPQPAGETPFSLLKGSPAPELSASTPSTPLCSDTVLSPPQIPASEQKALVLYRPVNPPLFPGGPPCGSVDLPIALKMHSSLPLILPQGTDTGYDSSCFETTSDLASQSPFYNDKDTLSGHGLFQALDLSGGPSHPAGQKRLTRVLSCPRFSFAMDDLPMIEEIDDKSAQQLQVVPWVPNSTAALLANTKPIIEEIDDGPLFTPDIEEMAEGESMEVVNEDIIVPEVGTTTMGGQFGSPLPTFSAAPWQQCETLQPPFTKVMWSH